MRHGTRCVCVYIVSAPSARVSSQWVTPPPGERGRHITHTHKHKHTSVIQDGESACVCVNVICLHVCKRMCVCVCVDLLKLWPLHWVCVCVLSGARQMWAVRPHCLHTTPWCDLGGCRWPWLAASYQLIKPLTRGHSASRHTLHLFHNTRTQSHTLVRGAPQVWQAATCSTHTHTHHRSSVAEGLSGLGDPAEPWLTLIGSLHHTSSHLDADWLADRASGSWLTAGEQRRRIWDGKIWMDVDGGEKKKVARRRK